MSRKLKKNKKGNFPDIPEFIAAILVIGFVVVICTLFFSSFNSNIQSMNESLVPEIVKNASSNANSAIGPGGDILAVFVVIIFISFSVMAARLIPSSPKFVIISIIALVLLPLAAMIAENVWNEFAINSNISPTIAGLKFLPFILDNLVVITICYSLFVAIALLTKTEETL